MKEIFSLDSALSVNWSQWADTDERVKRRLTASVCGVLQTDAVS
jgi:hypothetical protein